MSAAARVEHREVDPELVEPLVEQARQVRGGAVERVRRQRPERRASHALAPALLEAERLQRPCTRLSSNEPVALRERRGRLAAREVLHELEERTSKTGIVSIRCPSASTTGWPSRARSALEDRWVALIPHIFYRIWLPGSREIGMEASSPQGHYHAPRLAAVVAGELRRRILGSELADGAQLPKQEQLLAEFGVSPPTLREALRILESEGLVRVRRGKRGGSVVYRPTSATAAYAIAKVLEAGEVELPDVARALQALEPVCLELAARRPDRHEVVSRLRALHQQAAASLDDSERYRNLSHELHNEFVAASGSQTLALLAGALEALWIAHARERAATRRAPGVPDEIRQAHLTAHAAIIDAVERGDADAARQLSREHLCEATRHALAPGAATAVDSTSLAPGGSLRSRI